MRTKLHHDALAFARRCIRQQCIRHLSLGGLYVIQFARNLAESGIAMSLALLSSHKQPCGHSIRICYHSTSKGHLSDTRSYLLHYNIASFILFFAHLRVIGFQRSSFLHSISFSVFQSPTERARRTCLAELIEVIHVEKVVELFTNLIKFRRKL